MRLLRFIVLFVAMFAFGCVNVHKATIEKRYDVSVSVYVDPAFSPTELSEIYNGIETWHSMFPDVLIWCFKSFGVGPGCGYDSRVKLITTFVRVVSSNVEIVDADGDSDVKNTLGLKTKHLPNTRLLLVSDRLVTPMYWRNVAAHEFGHCLGLSHVDDKDSMMSEYITLSRSGLSRHDVDAFCDTYACSTMND